MSEWWTYRLGDFLLFSPAIYWRLFESMNARAWPLAAVLGAGALWLIGVVVGLLVRRPVRPIRLTAWRVLPAWVAGAWLAVAGLFLWQRYAAINVYAAQAVPAFVLQAVVMAALPWLGGIECHPSRRRQVGVAVGLCAAVLLYPLSAPLFGRPWSQAEAFGLAPDPTALAALCVLLMLRARTAAARCLLYGLYALPMGVCALGAATLWAMGSLQALVPVLGAALLIGLGGLTRSASEHPTPPAVDLRA